MGKKEFQRPPPLDVYTGPPRIENNTVVEPRLSFALPCIPGDHVLIVPLDNMKARVTRVEITAEEGWIVECRYFHEGEAKTIRCFVDEVVGA